MTKKAEAQGLLHSKATSMDQSETRTRTQGTYCQVLCTKLRQEKKLNECKQVPSRYALMKIKENFLFQSFGVWRQNIPFKGLFQSELYPPARLYPKNYDTSKYHNQCIASFLACSFWEAVYRKIILHRHICSISSGVLYNVLSL